MYVHIFIFLLFNGSSPNFTLINVNSLSDSSWCTNMNDAWPMEVWTSDCLWWTFTLKEQNTSEFVHVLGIEMQKIHIKGDFIEGVLKKKEVKGDVDGILII